MHNFPINIIWKENLAMFDIVRFIFGSNVLLYYTAILEIIFAHIHFSFLHFFAAVVANKRCLTHYRSV